jgi:hypothetical protein
MDGDWLGIGGGSIGARKINRDWDEEERETTCT